MKLTAVLCVLLLPVRRVTPPVRILQLGVVHAEAESVHASSPVHGASALLPLRLGRAPATQHVQGHHAARRRRHRLTLICKRRNTKVVLTSKKSHLKESRKIFKDYPMIMGRFTEKKTRKRLHFASRLFVLVLFMYGVLNLLKLPIILD